MLCRLPVVTAPMQTFAALAVVLTAWRHTAARVSGHDGRYSAVCTAPPGALVTPRSSAADAAGGTVTETITSAYRTGR